MKTRPWGVLLTLLIALLMVAPPAFAQDENEEDIPDPGIPPKGLSVKMFVHYVKNHEKAGVITAGATEASYIYSGYHWDDPDGADNQGIPYLVNFNYPVRKSPGLVANQAQSSIDQSFRTWVDAQDIGSTRLLYRNAGSTGSNGGRYDRKNVISWKGLRSGTIAVTYVWYNPTTKAIAEFDMLLNANYSWSVTAPDMTGVFYDPNGPTNNGLNSTYGDPINTGIPNTFDIQDIITHEAGHTLMLDDIYEAGAESLTMFGYSSYGELNKDTLLRGDYLGLNYIY